MLCLQCGKKRASRRTNYCDGCRPAMRKLGLGKQRKREPKPLRDGMYCTHEDIRGAIRAVNAKFDRQSAVREA